MVGLYDEEDLIGSLSDKELEALEAEVENHMYETLGRDEEAEIEVVNTWEALSPDAIGRDINDFRSWEDRGVKIVKMKADSEIKLFQADSLDGSRLLVTSEQGGLLLTTKDFYAEDLGWTEIRLSKDQARDLAKALIDYAGLEMAVQINARR